MIWRALLLLVALAGPLRAEEIVLGLSSDQVGITATFDGSDILIFGAVKRDTPAPAGPPLAVVITVSGPLSSFTVWKKERRYGIWMNTESIHVDAAPSFYAVATTGPLDQVLSQTEDLRHSVSIPRAIRSIGNDVVGSVVFTEALIRVRTEAGLFKMVEGAIDLEEETLFRTQVALPANLVEGQYRTRIFLTRDGQVIDTYETVIAVQKIGIERWLFNLAHETPLAYGLLAIAIAILSGWGASAAFQLLRR